MNVLYFGSTDGTSTALHYFTAFQRLGLNAMAFDPRTFDTESPWERALLRARRAPSASRCRALASHLEWLCRRNRFDLVFVMGENFLSGQTIRRIRERVPHPPRFLYHSHDNNYSKGVLKPHGFFSETLPLYDHVFTTKSANVSRYRMSGVKHAHYVPSAYEPSLHRPLPTRESRLEEPLEAVFIGTYDQSRDPFVEAVGWERLRVWGSHWRRYRRYHAHRDRITPEPIYYLQPADVLSHCRLALGLLREEAEDRHTQRTFEIPACGALQIAPRNDEILSFFTEDKEIVCFSTVDELREKTSHYLKHESVAKRIAAAGHRRCLNGGHTYLDRAAEMVRLATGERALLKRVK